MDDKIKADVAMCAWGKPFQTALTLASLQEKSGHRIGRVFIQEDPRPLFGDTLQYLFLAFPGLKITQFRPKVTIARAFFDERRFRVEEDYRLSVRYQLPWERGEAPYLFITHNDCLFNGDAIGLMMEGMGNEFAGAGQIGQCWNCPASFARRCSGPTHEQFNPSYDEAIKLVVDHPGPRTPEWSIHKDSPSPFPECRLNEFACLINKVAVADHVMPAGRVPPFGAMSGDIGTSWFRGLRLAGLRFLDERRGYVHAPFSREGAGFPATNSEAIYRDQEARAREYLVAHYPETAARMDELRCVTARAARVLADC